MAGKANTFENDLLKLIFNATAIADIAENDATSPLTQLFVSLHTAYPGEAGDQTTSECNYGSYARVAVDRDTGGWTVTNNSVSPAANIQFPAATSGSNTALFFGIGTATSGAGKLLYFGGIGSAPLPFTATASDDVVSIPGAALAVDDRIAFFTAEGATLPTGITEGTVYFVKTAPSATTCTLATTSGGATVDITANGAGIAQEITPLVITSSPQVTPILSTSTTIKED